MCENIWLYLSRNIFVDKPTDQSSRWSSDSNHPPQVTSCLKLNLCRYSSSSGFIWFKNKFRLQTAFWTFIFVRKI